MTHEIVYRVSHPPRPTALSLKPLTRPAARDNLSFDVVLIAQPMQGMAKRAEVQPMIPGWSSFSIIADEGKAIGGADGAPAPLSYFAAGIAFCLLTHLTAYAQGHNLDIRCLRIELRMRFSTNHTTDELPAHGLFGKSEGIDLHVVVEGNEPFESVKKMIDESSGASMALQSIVHAVPVSTHLHMNDQDVLI